MSQKFLVFCFAVFKLSLFLLISSRFR